VISACVQTSNISFHIADVVKSSQQGLKLDAKGRDALDELGIDLNYVEDGNPNVKEEATPKPIVSLGKTELSSPSFHPPTDR